MSAAAAAGVNTEPLSESALPAANSVTGIHHTHTLLVVSSQSSTTDIIIIIIIIIIDIFKVA